MKTFKYMLMPVFKSGCGVEYVTKKLFTQLTKQKILRFKMRVKGCPAYVRALYYFANGNLTVFLF